jgi:hypothetical protein
MKVLGLDGRQHTWYLVGHVPPKDSERPRSTLHLRARALLYKLYPSDRILEEVPLPGSEGLFADFYVPQRKLMIEANGAQHYGYISFFHGNQLGFLESKKHDTNKRSWCKLNKITLVELPFNEDDNEWRDRINAGTEA